MYNNLTFKKKILWAKIFKLIIMKKNFWTLAIIEILNTVAWPY